MLYKILKKVINTKVGRGNYWLATGGLTLAVLLILSAVFVKYNFQKLQGNKSQYLVITKIVTGKMMVNQSLSTFSKAQVNQLASSEHFDSVQPVQSSLFKCKLRVPMESLPLSTDMFFESVPDHYIDNLPKDWKWSIGENTIQAVAPRFFVDMYNYGFAVGQQMPQLSDSTITQIPFDFYISNQDESKKMKFSGRIGSLSNRFYSLLVPESFLNWANQNFGYVSNKQPTSVIVKAKEPASEKMHAFLKKNGFKSDYGMSRYSHYAFAINAIDKVATVLGILLFLFVLIIFVLYLQLTISNAKEELTLLTSLGTSPKQLRQYLLRKTLPAHFAIFAIILIAFAITQYLLSINKSLIYQEFRLPAFMPWQVIFTAIILFGMITFINYRTIVNKLK